MKSSLDYIQESIALGVSNHEKIIERAKGRIAEIDKELQRADELRIEKINLRDILVDMGDDTYKKKKTTTSSIEVPTPEDDSSEESLRLQKRICNILIAHGPLTNREILTYLARENPGEHQVSEEVKGIHAIKALGQKQIIQRDGTPENKIVQGSNWGNRPEGN